MIVEFFNIVSCCFFLIFVRVMHVSLFQAVEIITCCVKPVEKGDSWTHEVFFNCLTYSVFDCMI